MRAVVCPAGGLDVIPKKRSTLLLAAVALFAIVWNVPGEAQIIASYPPPYRYGVNPDSSVRIEVTPKQAEVYVDGYYAGIVDDFDGVFQRLRVEPGQHEITIYHDGYRTIRQTVYLMPDKTFKIKMRMEPLAAGEAGDARPVPIAPPVGVGAPGPPPGQPPAPRRGRRVPPPNGPPNVPSPPNGPTQGGPPPAAQAGTGTLAIQLQPADADVMIDGQPWPSQRQDRLVIDVSEGRHVVQVRKPGYVGYLTEVEVRRGETTTLTISLRMQP